MSKYFTDSDSDSDSDSVSSLSDSDSSSLFSSSDEEEEMAELIKETNAPVAKQAPVRTALTTRRPVGRRPPRRGTTSTHTTSHIHSYSANTNNSSINLRAEETLDVGKTETSKGTLHKARRTRTATRHAAKYDSSADAIAHRMRTVKIQDDGELLELGSAEAPVEEEKVSGGAPVRTKGIYVRARPYATESIESKGTRFVLFDDDVSRTMQESRQLSEYQKKYAERLKYNGDEPDLSPEQHVVLRARRALRKGLRQGADDVALVAKSTADLGKTSIDTILDTLGANYIRDQVDLTYENSKANIDYILNEVFDPSEPLPPLSVEMHGAANASSMKNEHQAMNDLKNRLLSMHV